MKLLIEIAENNYKEMCEHGIERVDFDIQRMMKNATPIPDNGKEVKDEATNWTPVTKGTPRDGELVNITWINHNPEPYYEAIKDKPFTATAYYFKGKWYWFSSTTEDFLEEYGDCPWDRIDEDLEITAWRSLPKPYKGEEQCK